MKFNGCFYASGSVRQLIKRPGKPWQGVLKYKDGETWRSVTTMLEATGKKDAEAKLIEWQKAMESKAAVSIIIKGGKSAKAELNKTVAEVVYAFVEKQYKLGELEKSSYTDQLNNFRQRAEPYIGSIPFLELTREQIQEWLMYLKGEKHYKWHTVKHVWAMLKKVYNYYLAQGEIDRNPCMGIVYRNDEPTEINTLDARGMEKFLAKLDGYGRFYHYRNAFEFPLWTGMRTEEVCGLRWQDVNLVAGYLSVNQAIGVVRTNIKDTYVKRPKSKSSRRKIPLMPQAEEVLRRQYEYQLSKYRLQHQSAKEVPQSHYVFGPEDGTEYSNPMKLCVSFKNFARRKNIVGTNGKVISLHVLRHTFATNAVKANVDIKSISSILGHADAAMTLNIYARADDDAIFSGIRKLGNFYDNQEETAGYINV